MMMALPMAGTPGMMPAAFAGFPAVPGQVMANQTVPQPMAPAMPDQPLAQPAPAPAEEGQVMNAQVCLFVIHSIYVIG